MRLYLYTDTVDKVLFYVYIFLYSSQFDIQVTNLTRGTLLKEWKREYEWGPNHLKTCEYRIRKKSSFFKTYSTFFVQHKDHIVSTDGTFLYALNTYNIVMFAAYIIILPTSVKYDLVRSCGCIHSLMYTQGRLRIYITLSITLVHNEL